MTREDRVFQPRLAPLVKVEGFDFVRSIIIDYMHLISLGVMRPLISNWVKGPRKLCVRLSKTQREIVFDTSISLRNSLPTEFVRRPRDLNQFKF